MLALLLDPASATQPLSAQLTTASRQLSGMHNAGELDALDRDARCEMAGLSLFLASAADAARELEEALRPPSSRERRMTPIGAVVARIVRRARA